MSILYLLITVMITASASALKTCAHPSARYWNATSSVQSWPTSLSMSTTESTGSPQRTATVTVGAAGEFVFSPSTLNASVGTVIQFDFLARNHTLTQSDLWDPCHANHSFDTGFNQFNPRNASGKYLVNFKVTSDRPQWFFCSQAKPKSHCRSGMVFSLNAQGSEDIFLQNALMDHAPPLSPTSIVSACPAPTNSTKSTNQSQPVATGPSGGLQTDLLPTPIVPPIANTGNNKGYGSVLWIVTGCFVLRSLYIIC